MFNLARGRKWYFLISGIMAAVSLFFLLLPPGLHWGIEFTAGSTMTVRFQDVVEQADLRSALGEMGHPEAVIQMTGKGDFLLRLRAIDQEEKAQLEAGLRDRFGELTVLDFYLVSPVIAQEVRRNAAIAVAAAVAGILLYIAWAFRKMPSPLRWGACAVVALLHDVLIVLGAFAFLGRFFGVQVDALFITAVLSVLGYSDNNMVVVFDRIRENMKRGISKDFEAVVNRSLLDTVGRQLNTIITVVLAILAILLLGGVTIRFFMLALLIGVVVGTYSSLLLASQLLVAWERRRPTRR
ncbi:MAG TPA: protein translocase subunit SecF [Dehalococcoidia bacterium]|nr:protein translocase subunit SecF [Dehalococcoidia bacterium]